MTKQDVANQIMEIGVVPVVRASSAKQAMLAAAAVCAGGIPIVEVTMTVPGAIEVIAELSKSMGSEVLIGAGTVLDADTAQRCIDAGAEFIVSPGFNLETVKSVNEAGKLMMAGALTPSEVIAAWKAGSDFVKIFPCGAVGGAKYIKALKGPLPQISMIPTGGVNLTTAADFILAGAAALGIGGELVSASALESGDLAPIVEAARGFVSIVRNARKSA
ncbi:MAG TPA: bifunctional 4-hydroxy-2-oxoglutarate aldolase/2-dehydro-3-deoxy-phosphogluconate aldolase [Candidatus Dormibacteraeota bacterium]|jgi:2-dehydro-3-deoxyphosphogluconate aldolase/(4S)-4-hydroxy-2-oxoglutarate aldolase|nr:bifunctional 4-hydroxy-2-oxoglutarate aldolase/2-dehydro-3-deoxy-phosphogluconate aldolase [Candidatus Dormibacteraeota bacterium]